MGCKTVGFKRGGSMRCKGVMNKQFTIKKYNAHANFIMPSRSRFQNYADTITKCVSPSRNTHIVKTVTFICNKKYDHM